VIWHRRLPHRVLGWVLFTAMNTVQKVYYSANGKNVIGPGILAALPGYTAAAFHLWPAFEV